MESNRQLDIQVYENLDQLQRLVPAWNDLLSDFPAASTFSTPEWLVPWWRAFGESQQLMVLAFFDSQRKLIGLAPLSLSLHRASGGLRFRSLRLMGDGSQDSDNLDLPVRPGYEEQFTRALFDTLKEHKSLWDVVQLNTLPGDSPTRDHLLQYLKQHSCTHFRDTRPGSMVTLPASWEHYLGQLSRKNRENLRRYSRELERNYRVTFYKCAEQKELARCLEALFCLHQKRWTLKRQEGSFASDRRRQFYYEMARSLLDRQRLEFWLLQLNETIVAADFGFRHGDTVYALQSGFDPAYSSYGVGYVLKGHMLNQLIAEGVRRYDFLGGENSSKSRWGAKSANYHDLHFARRRSWGGICLWLVHFQKESKEWLQIHLPNLAWSVLHRLNLRARRAGH